MDKYIIYHEFGKRYFTSKQNYEAYVRNASKIIDLSKFPNDDAAKQYIIDNWKLLESQIEIVR